MNVNLKPKVNIVFSANISRTNCDDPKKCDFAEKFRDFSISSKTETKIRYHT